MPLEQLWPTRDNINDCIRLEAETLSDACFLAIHQPIWFERIAHNGSIIPGRFGEEAFLKAFLTNDLPSGTLVLPILGSSGVGKSHMIRWLDARLKQLPDAETRHIIRIPKSASLRHILELILKDLDGDAYEEIRRELRTARERIDQLNAVEDLVAKLRIVLQQRAMDASERIKAAKKSGERGDASDRAIRAHGSKETGLPALLSDPTFNRHYTGIVDGREGILHAIAREVVEGLTAEEATRTSFSPEGLLLYGVELEAAGRPALRYYQQISGEQDRNKQKREEAVSLLNDVLDEALAKVIDLGGARLGDLFLKVRENLWHEKKELVLLVEDFAALAGIQGSLLDVIIKEAVRDGEQERCTMRTALAVTEGYLSSRETVQTRTPFELRIRDDLDDEREIIKRAVDIVGAYLNAARIGKKALNEQWTSDKRIMKWKPLFNADLSQEEYQQALALGRTKSKHWLFPFNQHCIEQMTRRHCTRGTKLVLNPRLLIRKVLRSTLLHHRDDWLKQSFPPSDFDNMQSGDLSGDVVDWLKRHHLSGKSRRYQVLLRYWGGNPRDISKIPHLPAELYKSFHLAPIQLTGAPTPRDPPEEEPKGTPSTPKHKSKTVDPYKREADQWGKVLDHWRNGRAIPNIEANSLRKWVLDGAQMWADWDSLLLKPPSGLSHRKVYIPNALGGQPNLTPEGALITVAGDGVLKDEDKRLNISQTLLAVARYNIYKGWDYDKADQDFSRYANLMARVTPPMTKAVQENYFDESEVVDTVPALTQALLLGARILDLSHGHAKDEAEQVAAVFAVAENIVSGTFAGDSHWNRLRAKVLEIRPDLQQWLLLQVAARQGGAGKIHAIDTARLLSEIRTLKKTWRISSTMGGERRTPTTPQCKRIYQHTLGVTGYELGKLDTIAENQRKSWLAWRDDIRHWMGDYSKEDVADSLMQTLVEVSREGKLDQTRTNTSALRNQIKIFRDSLITAVLNDLERVVDAPHPGTLLSVLARSDTKILDQTTKLMKEYDAFLQRTERILERDLSEGDVHLVEQVTAELDQELESLARILIGEEQ